MDLQEIQAKTILTPCKIPDIDFVINPYVGCGFACKYCYASFMSRFVNKPIQEWGTFVYAKVNAPELLAKEFPRKIKDKGKDREVIFSTVTDPYQGLEVKYQLTRQCLQILADFGFEGTVSILTKSKLVTRDIDVLKQFKHISVGLTVTSTDDSISRYFEKFAPPVSQRFEALETMNKEGIKTYAFIGPLLPHFVAYSDELEKLIRKLAAIGTRDVYIEHLNLAPYIKDRFLREVKDVDQTIISTFYASQSKQYREELNRKVYELVKKYGMNLRTDDVIYHKEFQQTGK